MILGRLNVVNHWTLVNIYIYTHTGPTFPLVQLGNCIRPQVEGEPQNFRKEGVEGKKKKKVLDESKKNQAHAFDQKTKFLLYPVKHL